MNASRAAREPHRMIIRIYHVIACSVYENPIGPCSTGQRHADHAGTLTVPRKTADKSTLDFLQELRKVNPKLWALLPQDTVIRLLASMWEALGISITQMLPAKPTSLPARLHCSN